MVIALFIPSQEASSQLGTSISTDDLLRLCREELVNCFHYNNKFCTRIYFVAEFDRYLATKLYNLEVVNIFLKILANARP